MRSKCSWYEDDEPWILKENWPIQIQIYLLEKVEKSETSGQENENLY